MLYSNKITGVRAGEPFSLERSYAAVPRHVSVTSVQFILKSSAAASPQSAFLSSLVTTAGGNYGILLDNGLDFGVAKFTLKIPVLPVNSQIFIDQGILNAQISWIAT